MTKVINIDSLKQEPPVVLVIDGVRHAMKIATVDTFIKNMEAIEALGMNASPVKELEAIVGIVHRAFPSLTLEQIRSWDVNQIQELSKLAQGVGGEEVSTDPAVVEEAKVSGN